VDDETTMATTAESGRRASKLSEKKRLAMIKKKRKQKQKQKEGPTQRELDLANITDGVAVFQNMKSSESAKDCLIAAVMAMDADADGGCKLVMSNRSAQHVVIRAMGALEGDRESVTACCMLLRSCLRSGAKDRMKQITHYIDCDLGTAMGRALEVHAADAGFINTECSALVDELGTQFERILNPL
jgi:hypothetical protein